MLAAAGPALETPSPTPAATPVRTLPRVWGPGRAAVAWPGWGAPSLLATLPWWQGPGKKKNK